MIRFQLAPGSELVAIGAHCDDLAIGAGATIRQLTASQPQLRIRVFVACGSDPIRVAEERAAWATLAPGCPVEFTFGEFGDARLPGHWSQVKALLDQFAAASSPDLIFAPQRGDAHQDHRLLAELTPTAFRDHLVLGYEILKWESDLPRTQLYVPISADEALAKYQMLATAYPSQASRDWFDQEAFLALLRIRGAQAHTRYAEGFVCEKALVQFSASDQAAGFQPSAPHPCARVISPTV